MDKEKSNQPARPALAPPKKLGSAKECENWCKRAGVTLRFTRHHVAAHHHLHPLKQVVGESIPDAVNALRRLMLKPSK